ncbi:hypothetical protein ACH5A3_40965 [Streptomyces echinatus]|uniref:hypothetical protein n=1 Tax=Streptomyces echinatus TaxID=67293 RepID=UPI0037BA569F
MKISRRPELSEDERLAALGRLLTDADTPMRLRVAGLIILLYAQPLTRIVQLTVDDVLHDGETTLLRLGPARPDHMSSRLREIGIPVTAARGAAIRQQLLELPAPVVADALGYHDKTTSRLLRESGGTWSRYAAGDHGRSPAGWAPKGIHDS